MITLIVAFTALTGVFLFFRIERVIDILIGDGQAALENQKNSEENSKEPLIDPKYQNRLRDAIFRKNIWGVEEGLLRISRKEINSDSEPGPTGYSKHVYPKFKRTKKILGWLKLMLVGTVILSLISAFLLSICKPNSGFIGILDECAYLVLKYLSYVFTVAFFVLILFSIFYSIYFKTPHEKEKVIECRKLKL